MRTVLIEKESYGSFIARDDGKIIFIPYAVPGETCSIDIIKSKKDFSFGVINSIIEPSPLRTEPECAAFGICGGCDYLHVSYETELEFKKNIISDTASRIGKFTVNPSILHTVAAERFGYRSRCTVKSDGRNNGFYAKNSNSVIPFPENGCVLLSPHLNDYIKSNFLKSSQRLSLSCQNEVISGEGSNVNENENGFNFVHKSGSFFQSNRFLRSKMLQITSESAGKFSNALDIGCGCGFFTIPLSKNGKITGIDISSESIKSAEISKGLNESNAFFKTMDMNEIHVINTSFDLIIADPPRSGMDERTRKTVNKINPSRIIYISCSPPTWARDASDFISHGYKLDKVYFVDMFPGTMHIELISVFNYQP